MGLSTTPNRKSDMICPYTTAINPLGNPTWVDAPLSTPGKKLFDELHQLRFPPQKPELGLGVTFEGVVGNTKGS